MNRPLHDCYESAKDRKLRVENTKTNQSAYTPPVELEDMASRTSNILVVSGLPGSGKTTIASNLAHRIRCVHLNADEVRRTVNAHLGFTKKDRMLQAQAFGNMSRWIADADNKVVVDFVCPDFDTRLAFLDMVGQHRHFVSWVEVTRPGIVSRYADTRAMYESLHDYPNRDLLHLKKFRHLVNKEQDLTELSDEVYDFFTKD